MTISILVLKDEQSAHEFNQLVWGKSLEILKLELIEPSQKKQAEIKDTLKEEESFANKSSVTPLRKLNINDVKLLNPKLARKERQSNMNRWLMPFGLLAGITFSGMTNLNTFAEMGFGPIGEIFFGGLLGMASGWIGSFFAALSVNTYEEDIDSLRKKHDQGYWLLLLQTPFETEPPWQLIQEINPIEIVSLGQL
ncbi:MULTISPECIES: hypothetical protein [Prochlorococcus]|uniref:hypothetical protein n=1 Tax=Prochlorococcus TaxID=1218 RepID=UPI000533AF17|nr:MULTISPECIES: hypothetical protein [Prochlorococcus]KGG11918.1 hypothetical protein EV05_1119 [Prochlorococcus sp. MIT 0601]